MQRGFSHTQSEWRKNETHVLQAHRLNSSLCINTKRVCAKECARISLRSTHAHEHKHMVNNSMYNVIRLNDTCVYGLFERRTFGCGWYSSWLQWSLLSFISFCLSLHTWTILVGLNGNHENVHATCFVCEFWPNAIKMFENFWMKKVHEFSVKLFFSAKISILIENYKRNRTEYFIP